MLPERNYINKIGSYVLQSVFVIVSVVLAFNLIFKANWIALAIFTLILFFVNLSKPVVLIIFSILFAIPARPLLSWVDGMITYEGLALIFAFISFVFKKALIKEKNFHFNVDSSDGLFLLMAFFALLTYVLNPVLPSFAWFGASTEVSGFAQWVKLFVGLLIFWGMRYILRDRNHAVFLLRKALWLSFFSSFILLVAAFSNSGYLLNFLYNNGIYIASVGSVNRFVILQHFTLLSLLAFLFPLLFGIKKNGVRYLLLIHALTCLFLSGNRANIVSYTLGTAATYLILRRYKTLLLLFIFGTVIFFAGYYFVKSDLLSTSNPVTRIYSLVDDNIAHDTGAAGTTDWRQEMWSLAWYEARQKPLGHGFISQSISEVLRFRDSVGVISHGERIRHIIDKGNMHNCFVSTAYTFGIPAAITYLIWTLFILVRCSLIIRRYNDLISIALIGSGFLIFCEKAIHFIGAGNLHEPKIYLIWGIAMSLIVIGQKEQSKSAVINLDDE